MKKCYTCKDTKDRLCFGKLKKAKDGLHPRCKECRKKYYVKNAQKRRDYSKKWREDNPEKLVLQLDRGRARRNYTTSLWSKNNRGKRNISWAKYNAKKKKALPTWLTPLQKSQIKSIYLKCAEYRSMGIDMHVDHIIPLQGKNVCGLHVPWNLRIMLASENQSKGNKYKEKNYNDIIKRKINVL